MYDWRLLSVNYDTGVELWKTPTKYLVCQKYLGYFKFLDTEKQARPYFEQVVQSKCYL